MNVTIQTMQLEDIDQVFQLEKSLFIDSWTKNSFTREVENTDISFPLVMKCGDEIIGYAVIWIYAQELHIANFAIAPQYQRKGLGRQLLEYVMNMSNNYNLAFLEVRENNRAAIELYHKAGFKTLYIRKNYYRDGESAIVMVFNK